MLKIKKKKQKKEKKKYSPPSGSTNYGREQGKRWGC